MLDVLILNAIIGYLVLLQSANTSSFVVVQLCAVDADLVPLTLLISMLQFIFFVYCLLLMLVLLLFSCLTMHSMSSK